MAKKKEGKQIPSVWGAKFKEIAERLNDAKRAAELSQAALKLVRAKCMTGSPTPVTAAEAEKKLLEEFADVMISAEIVGVVEKRGKIAIYMRKVRRMAQRLGLLEGQNE